MLRVIALKSILFVVSFLAVCSAAACGAQSSSKLKENADLSFHDAPDFDDLTASPIQSIRFMQTKRGFVLLGTNANETCMVDIESRKKVWGSCSRQATDNANGISKIVFSSDERFAAVGGFRKTVDILDSASGDLLTSLNLDDGEGICAFAMQFSPDGRFLAVLSMATPWKGSFDWDFQAYAFIPKGRQYMFLFDTQTGKLIKKFDSIVQPVISISFSSDGSLIYNWGRIGFQIWNLRSGQLIRTVTAADLGLGENLRFMASEPSIDWRLVATHVDNGDLYVIDLETVKIVNKIGSPKYTDSISFTRDGSQLIVIDDGKISSWNPVSGTLNFSSLNQVKRVNLNWPIMMFHSQWDFSIDLMAYATPTYSKERDSYGLKISVLSLP